MAATFYIKQNDTAPTIEAALTDSNGRRKPMTNVSAVRFHMKDENDNVLIQNGIGSVIDGPRGVVAYEWQTGDTANTGMHNAEFQITYNNGQVETFPNTGYIRVIVKGELA